MKILVGYFSETGNTKKIAAAMGEEATLCGHDVLVAPVGEIRASSLGDFDVVFLGSTCHSADVAAPVMNILNNIPNGSSFRLAGFVTHSTTMPEAGSWEKEMYERWAGRCSGTFRRVSAERGIDFLGFFHCQGGPSPQIEAFIRNTVIPDDKRWNTYIEEARKHPTSEDIEAAKRFVRDALAKR